MAGGTSVNAVYGREAVAIFMALTSRGDSIWVARESDICSSPVCIGDSREEYCNLPGRCPCSCRYTEKWWCDVCLAFSEK